MTPRPWIIGMDVDDVVLDLLPTWLRLYNDHTGDNLLPEDIKGWNIGAQADKMDIYSILHDPCLYKQVMPVHGARQDIYKILSAGHRVVYVSSCVGNTMGAKIDCLVRYGFLTKKNRDTDFIAATDKSLVSGVDMLFDDRVHNAVTFPEIGVVVNRGHNKGEYTAHCHRADVGNMHGVVQYYATRK